MPYLKRKPLWNFIRIRRYPFYECCHNDRFYLSVILLRRLEKQMCLTTITRPVNSDESQVKQTYNLLIITMFVYLPIVLYSCFSSKFSPQSKYEDTHSQQDRKTNMTHSIHLASSCYLRTCGIYVKRQLQPCTRNNVNDILFRLLNIYTSKINIYTGRFKSNGE